MKLRIQRRHLYQRSLLLMTMLPFLIALAIGAPRTVVIGCFAIFAAGFIAKYVIDFHYLKQTRR